MVETTYEAQVRQIAAFDDLLEYFQEQKPRWDGDVAAAQAAYAALAGNLKGVVNSQMFFTGLIDPDIAEPTLTDGGTFNTIAQFVSASPPGSYAEGKLVAGKEYPISTIHTYGRSLAFKRTGVGDNPVIKPTAVISGGTLNIVNSFLQLGHCSLLLGNVDVTMPEKLDPALPWYGPSHCLILNSRGSPSNVQFIDGKFTGSAGAALSSVGLHNTVSVLLSNCTLDGDVYAVSGNTGGITTISRGGVTLLNGAAYTENGVIGTQVLMN